MARQNVARFQDKGVRKIVTQCPHCFSILNNDYRQYGLEVEALHHSQLLAQLLEQGKLNPPKAAPMGKLLFHDSCYLGRHNDTYQLPRQVIQAALRLRQKAVRGGDGKRLQRRRRFAPPSP